jgi:hypothetical protein
VSDESIGADGGDLQRWVTAGVVATAVIVLSLPLYLVKERIAATERGVTEAAPAEFVGREQCISCHEQAYEAWRGSDHDHAMTMASDSTVRGDFDDAVFVYRGDTTRFYRRDGKYYVHAEGPDGLSGTGHPRRRLAALDPRRTELERDVCRVSLHQPHQGLRRGDK